MIIEVGVAGYAIEYTESAVEDLRSFRRFEQALILDTIDRQLIDVPDVETRQRKPLRPNALAPWELRIGDYRIFYAIDQGKHSVSIIAIGYKDHNTLYIRGKEYRL